jgi:3-phosphoshikimate 1-carboxyvinyltransferase
MEITVHPSYLKGKVEAPASKSLTQRAIAAGLLAHGTTVIHNPSFCNDSLAAIRIAEALGAVVATGSKGITIESGPLTASPVTLHCGESGLALRMFSPVAALLTDHVSLTGEGSLMKRPVKMIGDALSQLGVKVMTSNGFLPVTLNGRLKGGRAVIDGSTGSQLLTGLLMALPLADGNSEIEVMGLKSRPYINLTLEMLSGFGITVENRDFSHFSIPGNQSYRAREYNVEGDWSGAAFLLVAGALAGEVSVRNLSSRSLQADRAIMKALSDAGCHLTETAEEVRTEKSDLRAFSFDATDSPDLFPPLAALAAGCRGISRIKGISRLVHKESDRAGTITAVLGALGIRTAIEGDEILISGGRAEGATVSSHNDHRIAMMAAVMATVATGGVTIRDAEAVAKSYPGFFDDLSLIGAAIS